MTFSSKIALENVINTILIGLISLVDICIYKPVLLKSIALSLKSSEINTGAVQVQSGPLRLSRRLTLGSANQFQRGA